MTNSKTSDEEASIGIEERRLDEEREAAPKKRRGFAIMNPQRQIASMGGRAAHAKGTAHEFTPEQARAAGRKGGVAYHQARTGAGRCSSAARLVVSVVV